MPNVDHVLIFDLDQTVLTVNSFPYWVRYMLFGKFPKLTPMRRLRLLIETLAILIRRKLLGQSHATAKLRLQALWIRYADDDALNNLTTELLRRVRPNLQSLLELVKQGHVDAILATSAAGVYAKPLGAALGFTHILATDTVENRHETKRQRTLALLAEKGWEGRKRIFFTDHEEDMPLIKACNRTLWFGDDAKTDIPVIPCRNLSAADIMQLISA